jgi:lipocalin
LNFSLPFFLFFTISSAGRLKPKPEPVENDLCQEIEVMEHFAMNKFFGTWNEIYAYPYTLTDDGKCVTTTFGLAMNGNISIYNKFVDSRGLQKVTMGMAKEMKRGVLSVIFPATRELHRVKN